MVTLRLLVGVSVLFIGGAASAGDLSKIERVIAKEPDYGADEPRYCLVAIGPEAEQLIWLVAAGDALYVDRNLNGDLTDPDERVEPFLRFKIDNPNHVFSESRFYETEINVLDGKGNHRILRVSLHPTNERFVPQTPADVRQVEHLAHGEIAANVGIMRGEFSRDSGGCHFTRLAADTPILQFDGPMTLGLWGYDVKLARTPPTELRITLQVPGLGASQEVHVNHDDVPLFVHPIAEIIYPHKSPGAEPIRQTILLNERCCGNQFYAPVPVPDEAGSGVAEVQLSFPDLIEFEVAPATVQVEVEAVTAEP